MNETEFQKQVTDLAELLGYVWVHFRPARTAHGWATPVSGPLGKGWPDLILVRERDGRRLAVELKSDKGAPSLEQLEVLRVLKASGFETYLWRPTDFDDLVVVLR